MVLKVFFNLIKTTNNHLIQNGTVSSFQLTNDKLLSFKPHKHHFNYEFKSLDYEKKAQSRNSLP